MAGFIGPDFAANPPPVSLNEVDEISDEDFPREAKLSFKAACRRFGVDSFTAWLTRLKDFNAEERLAEIRCPTLAMVGAGEGAEALRQSKRFVESISGPATERIFTAEEGADAHCQVGNLALSNAVVFDWLDEIFAD